MHIKRSAEAISHHWLRQRTGRAHALLAGRGAAAIWATLVALDLHARPVLLPANTCYIVLWAVLQSGNQPILVDIDPLTANVSPETLERCQVDKPAVLIPAHMYGLPAPMRALTEWAHARSVFVIEDAALALGATADGKPAGSWGDVSVFSFGAGKTADIGFGGALLIDDMALAAEIERVLAAMPPWTEQIGALNRQWLEIYWALHQFERDTPRLAELYPALFGIYGGIVRCRATDWRKLVPALSELDANLAHRTELAALYDEAFADVPMRLLPRPDGAALWRYPLLVPSEHRNPLLDMLWRGGILDATRWYPSLQPMCCALAPDLPNMPTPAADQLAEQIINLPLAPDTDRAAPVTAAQIIRSYFAAL
jgi:dTDP-4-amino-4,6-dideoxygalactose transaminase